MKKLLTILLAALTAFTLACGYSSKSAAPATAGTMPAISELTPDNMNAGGAAFVLTVNGSDFSSKATINWDGTALTTTQVSANQLMATVPAADIATSATVPLTVTNPAVAGTGIYGADGTMAETSTAMNFTVN
ncbi:MAG: IPT/TIG domain-containing protein [Candidatus Sulfotelmatobacter sp.]